MLKKSDLERFNKKLFSKEIGRNKRSKVFSDFGGLQRIEGGLRTSLNDGLNRDPVLINERSIMYGANEIPQKPAKSLFAFVWERVSDKTILILSACAVLSLGLGLAFPEEFYDPDCDCTVIDSSGWIEGVAILAAVIIIVVVGALQDYDKDKKFRLLGQQDVRVVKVVRGGQTIELESPLVVVGDVVLLENGKQVPADGYLISSEGQLLVDESSMTGESEPAEKGHQDPLMLAGTTIVSGSCRMIVGCTGASTIWGGMMLAMVQSEAQETPLQQVLSKLVVTIGKVGLVFGVVTFEVLLIYWAIDTYVLIQEEAWSFAFLRGLVDALVIGITLLVVGIPEGLPLAVLLALAYSVKKMMHDKVLVRHLESCETIGGATSICSDKTGTLTQNIMSVRQVCLGGVESDLEHFSRWSDVHERFRQALVVGISVNSTALHQQREDGSMKGVGLPTELALLELVNQWAGQNSYQNARRDFQSRMLRQIPFSSETKCMVTIVRGEFDVPRMYVKGAPDVLLPRCTRSLNVHGAEVALSNEESEHLKKVVSVMGAEEGLRSILLAFRDLDEKSVKHATDEVEDLVVVGVVGMEDPLREEVPDAVARCQRAGITVRMVTGDFLGTAVKIAERCGIKTADGICLTGEEFRKMPDEEIDRLLPKLEVLARSQPTDKLRLVQRLRATNQIVAVTGDGTNDAPALREADVGLAMGVAGTDVAKEASDIVIMDDNFRSIVSAVKWGRHVYRSVRKFLQFQLTVNVVALVLVFVGAVSRYGAPLRAVQLLWINLIMDTLAALALATEPPTDALLDEKPHGHHEPIINNFMWRNIVGHSALQLALLIPLMFFGHLIPWTTGYAASKSRLAYTIIFNVFVWCQLFNEINARSVDLQRNVFQGLLKSWIFVGVWMGCCVIQVLIVMFGGTAFKITPLSWDQWLFCIGAGVLSLPFGALIRAIPVPKDPFTLACFRNRSGVVDIESEPLLGTLNDDEHPYYN